MVQAAVAQQLPEEDGEVAAQRALPGEVQGPVQGQVEGASSTTNIPDFIRLNACTYEFFTLIGGCPRVLYLKLHGVF